MANDVAKVQDSDPQETREWLESIGSVLDVEGTERAHFLIEQLIDRTRRSGAYLPFTPNTAYVNTIPVAHEPPYPGNRELEKRIEAYLRWNAAAMVVHANKENSGIGGHLASYASIGTLFEVGFNHFWRAPHGDSPGDLVYLQGHSSPGIYARSYLEGRLDEEQLLNFRREVERRGLSSYPHPWLMRDYWQFPSVSMGLGRLWPSTRRVSCAIWSIAALSSRRTAKCGASSATAKPMNRKRWRLRRWRRANTSIT